MSIRVKAEEIHLTSVQMLEAGIKTNEEYRANPVQPDNISLNTSTDLRINVEEEVVVLGLSIEMQAVANESDLGLTGQYNYRFVFQVENLHEFFDPENGIQGQMAATLVSIGYSTLRGIILERTKGTFFGATLLPVVDPKDIMKIKGT